MILIISIILVIIYAALILWFNAGLSKNIRRKTTGDNIYRPFISVIISARNEAHNIPGLIDTLINQTYPAELTEIIIVNDRSTDATADVLNSYSDQYQNLKIIHIPETKKSWAPKKWALHSAIQQSKGELILQTDADCIPHKQWVEAMAIQFTDPSTGFLSGPAPLMENNTFPDKIFELDSLTQDAFSAGGMGQGQILSCTGRNIAFRKIVFDEVEGYAGINDFLSGDDDLLLQKIASLTNWQIQFVVCPEAIVESPPPKSIKQFIRQRLRFASKGLAYYQLSVTDSVKLLMPFVFIVNLLVVVSIFKFLATESGVWLLPLILKSGSEAILSYSFFRCLNRDWSALAFMFLTVVHPFYVVVFGALGPFSKINWKENC